MKTLALVVVGMILAFGSRFAGRFAATVHRLDPHGARWTISKHLRWIARLLGSAGLAAAAVLAVFMAPGRWARWLIPLGMVALVFGNLSLGALGGASQSLGLFLARSHRWRSIDRLIQLKKRARAALKRFLPVLIVIAAASPSASAIPSDRACAIVVDETASVRASSLEDARAFIKLTFFEYVFAMDCSSVVVIRLGPEPAFAKRTWLGPIPKPPRIDCTRAEPAPIPEEASLFGWSMNIESGLKDEAEASCQQALEEATRDYSVRRSEVLRHLDDALSFRQVVEQSHVTAMVRYLTKGEVFVSALIASDLLDNPSVSVAGVDIPNGTSIVLIALEPDPRFGSVTDVTARMRLWERKSHVTVLTVHEVRPGIWSSVGSRR
jgi:hypothetical protein